MVHSVSTVLRLFHNTICSHPLHQAGYCVYFKASSFFKKVPAQPTHYAIQRNPTFIFW